MKKTRDIDCRHDDRRRCSSPRKIHHDNHRCSSSFVRRAREHSNKRGAAAKMTAAEARDFGIRINRTIPPDKLEPSDTRAGMCNVALRGHAEDLANESTLLTPRPKDWYSAPQHSGPRSEK